jgi:hypothetical protein
MGYGENCKIDRITHKDRQIFRISYEYYLKSEQSFDQQGNIASLSRRSIRYAAVIFFPQENVIRVKDTRLVCINGIRDEFGLALFDSKDFFNFCDENIIDLDFFRSKPIFPTKPKDRIKYVKLMSIKIRSCLDKETDIIISGYNTEHVYKKLK